MTYTSLVWTLFSCEVSVRSMSAENTPSLRPRRRSGMSISIYLDDKLLARLRKYADRMDVTTSSVLAVALAGFLDRSEEREKKV